MTIDQVAPGCSRRTASFTNLRALTMTEGGVGITCPYLAVGLVGRNGLVAGGRAAGAAGPEWLRATVTAMPAARMASATATKPRRYHGRSQYSVTFAVIGGSV